MPHRSALLVEAARLDARLHAEVARLETHHAQLVDRADQATSPLERAKLRRLAHLVHEVGGAARYSAVTGGDDSDLDRDRGATG